jgi:hypothetical protein
MPFNPTPHNDDTACRHIAELPDILHPHATGAILTAALPRLALEATYGEVPGRPAARLYIEWLLDATPGARRLARRYQDFLESLEAQHDEADVGTKHLAVRGHRAGGAATPILEPFVLDPAMRPSLARALAIIVSSTSGQSAIEASGAKPAQVCGPTDAARHGTPPGTDALHRLEPRDEPAAEPLEILLTTHGHEPLACGVLFTRDGAEWFDTVSMLRRRDGLTARNHGLLGLDALLLRDSLAGRAARPTALLWPSRDGYELQVDVDHAIGSLRREWGVSWAFLRRRCAPVDECGGARVKLDIPGISTIRGRMSVRSSSDPAHPVRSRMTFALDGGTLLRMAACERPCRFLAWGSRGNNNLIDTEPMLTSEAIRQSTLTMVSGRIDAQALGGRPFRIDLIPGIEWSERALGRLPTIPVYRLATNVDGILDGTVAPLRPQQVLRLYECANVVIL